MQDKLLANVRALASMTILVVALAATAVLAITSTSRQAASSVISIWWPQAPAYEKGFPVLIEAPKPEPPANDPLQAIISKGGFHGQLIYTPRIKLSDNPVAQRYLVLRQVGNDQAGNLATGATTYHVKVNEHVFDPQFSPDGQSILFKVGDPFFRFGGYQLFLWDLKAQHLRQVSQVLSYPTVSWSPDGNYLAFIGGGDVEGTEFDDANRLRLDIEDLKTGNVRMVTMNPAVTSLAWTRQGLLLFTMQPQKDQNQEHSAIADKQPLHPNIYEVLASGGEPKQVLQNGFDPNPSPDGKWIAFFGWPEITSQQTSTREQSANASDKPNSKSRNVVTSPALYLYNRAERKRILLRSQGYSSLRWTPDSKRLILIDTTGNKDAAGGIQSKAHIGFIQISDLRLDNSEAPVKNVANLEAHDFDSVTRQENQPQFGPLRVSQDGSALFINVSEYTGQDHGFYTESRSLQAVNLNTGAVSTIARLQNKWGSVLGWDWHDESANA